jgi:hypothetical protein
MWDGALSWCNSPSSFVAEVRGEVFAYFHAFSVKHHSIMRNGLFGLPGRILCEQSPWCQRKLWSCSWLYSSPVSPFSVSMRLDDPCMSHSFFPERFSNQCQGFRRTFSEICTKFNTDAMWDQLLNITKSSTWKINTSTQLRDILYTDSQYMIVLLSTVVSCYCNCCQMAVPVSENMDAPSYDHTMGFPDRRIYKMLISVHVMYRSPCNKRLAANITACTICSII